MKDRWWWWRWWMMCAVLTFLDHRYMCPLEPLRIRLDWDLARCEFASGPAASGCKHLPCSSWLNAVFFRITWNYFSSEKRRKKFRWRWVIYLDEMECHFPADGLVAVDVSHVLDIRFAFHMLKRRRRDHHYPQIATWGALGRPTVRNHREKQEKQKKYK